MKATPEAVAYIRELRERGEYFPAIVAAVRARYEIAYSEIGIRSLCGRNGIAPLGRPCSECGAPRPGQTHAGRCKPCWTIARQIKSRAYKARARAKAPGYTPRTPPRDLNAVEHPPCAGCGGQVERKPGEVTSKWLGRKSCSWACSYRCRGGGSPALNFRAGPIAAPKIVALTRADEVDAIAAFIRDHGEPAIRVEARYAAASPQGAVYGHEAMRRLKEMRVEPGITEAAAHNAWPRKSSADG